MSTAADQKAKAERLAAASSRRAHHQDQDTETHTPPAVEPPRSGRVKPVRVTLDLAPALHNELEDWTIRVGREFGAVRVNKVDVLRILARRLLSDEALQADVIDALRSELRR